MNSHETILVEQKNRVLLIALNRPERLNAISRDMISEVKLVMQQAEYDSGIAAVVLYGLGRAFSAGMDLKDDAMSGVSGAESWSEILTEDLDFILQFWDFSKPTIAVAHGFCLAAACELAMACDVTIAEQGTFFGEPELKFGSVITAMIMPYITGPKIAKELLLGADDRVTAERALSIGLVNQLVPRGEGLSTALTLANRISVMDDAAVRLTKKAINSCFDAQGFRASLRKNLELAVEIESMETPSRKKFKEITAERGLKAALQWREQRMSGMNTGKKQPEPNALSASKKFERFARQSPQ
jgi:enoyl-CoA hydratase